MMESFCAYSGKQIKDKMNREKHKFIANIKIPDDAHFTSIGLSKQLYSKNIILKSIEPFQEHVDDNKYVDDDETCVGIMKIMCFEYDGNTVKEIINRSPQYYVMDIDIYDDSQCYFDTKSGKIYCEKYKITSIQPIKKYHHSLSNDVYQYARVV